MFSLKLLKKYVFSFLVMIFLFVYLLTITAMIPNGNMKKNILSSKNNLTYLVNDYKLGNIHLDKYYQKQNRFRHPYADTMLLNVIWHYDSSDPLKSIMRSNYYSKTDPEQMDYSLEEIVENEGNTQYIRYWHGYSVFIKPLLTIFDLGQINVIAYVVMFILNIIFIYKLIKNKLYDVLFSYILGFILCIYYIVPSCIEYIWCYFIFLIASIICISLENKNKDIGYALFLTGMITCYLDFLTNEITTLLVPLIIILTMKYKKIRSNNNRINSKFVFRYVFRVCFLWLLGYVLTWLAKWVLASLILNVNAINYVKDSLLYRIGTTRTLKMMILCIKKNYSMLLFVNKSFVSDGICFYVPHIVLLIWYFLLDKKNRTNIIVFIVCVLISIVPYFRFALILNHSSGHFVFTYRDQIITIMSLTLGIINTVNFRRILCRKK